MAAIEDRIADGIAAILGAATLSQVFSTTRLDLPRRSLEAISGVVVTVVPRSKAKTILARSIVQEEVGVDVAVQAKVADDEPDTLAPYRTLTVEIDQLFEFGVIEEGGVRIASWCGSQIDPIYSPEHLEEHRLFTSVVRLTFKAVR